MFALIGVCGLIWFGSKVYARHSDHFTGGSIAPRMAALFGAPAGGSDEKEGNEDRDNEKGEDEGKSKAKKKESSSEADSSANKKESSGGGKSSKKSMTMGGIKVNFS